MSLGVDERYAVRDAVKSNNPLIKVALGALGVVCSELGPLRLEDLYHKALHKALLTDFKGVEVTSEQKVPVIYDKEEIGNGRTDLQLKQGVHQLVIELKGGRSTAATAKLDVYQLIHYLNDLKQDTGLLAYCGTPNQSVVDVFMVVRVGSVPLELNVKMDKASWAVIRIKQELTTKPEHVFYS